MFDFIRKNLLWEAWDADLHRKLGPSEAFELKTVQDLASYWHLRHMDGKCIAEVGAGHSRVLPLLAERNTCVVIDKYQGKGGGPTEAAAIPGVRHIDTYLGENDYSLESGSFDVVFSVSVVEHVGTGDELDAFHRDQLRILRPGGIFLHAIDLYLRDEPSAYELERFHTYRSWVVDTPEIEPLGHMFSGPCRFTCDLATNPDNIMYGWGKAAPDLIPLRQVAQCVSLLVGGRKSEVTRN